jgi:N-acetylglucosaminyldiphosphoundecaprenol N-acetyl-beta-D-mannosaminyltransferase
MERVCLDQVEIDKISLSGAVDQIMAITDDPYLRVRHVITVNAQFVGEAHSNKRLADLIRNAYLSVADGVPLVWSARLLGEALPGRVNGTDIMVRLCETSALQGKSVYFLGGHPGSADLAAQYLLEQFPRLLIAGIDCPPFGFVDDAVLDAEVSNKIHKAKPDIVFVALGAPKAEFWIEDHAGLPAKVMIGVGGSFELVGGVIKRAPIVFQKAGCEWLWRLIMEPRRLWKRYLWGNVFFVYLVARQWLSGNPRSSRSASPLEDSLLGDSMLENSLLEDTLP